jgi:hypothetical protein
VEETTSVEELTSIARGVVDLELPDEVAFRAYERVIELGEETPELLRRFAWRLEMSGPAFDTRAQALRHRASRLKGRRTKEP